MLLVKRKLYYEFVEYDVGFFVAIAIDQMRNVQYNKCHTWQMLVLNLCNLCIVCSAISSIVLIAFVQ